MSITADVIVAGAGIVGAACADFLTRAGLQVVIVEPGAIGGAATSASMGHIVVMDDSEAQFALTRYSRDLWNGLSSTLPADVEWTSSGTIWVAADDEEFAAVRQKYDFYAWQGVRVEILDSASLHEAEPNLRSGLAGGLLMPDDAVIYAPGAARWFVERAIQRGARLVSNSAVAEFQPGGVTLAGGSRISAACTVCACGTWATELIPSLPVRPRKGHLAITGDHPGFLRHQLVELGYLKSAHGSTGASVAFNVQPRASGQILIGSSRQYGETTTAVEQSMLQRMLARATEYMPHLANLPVIRTWAGLRAATYDKLPLIGPCPGRENLYLATGHEGLGITTSLGTAGIITDLIVGRNPAISPDPYLPSRIPGL